MNTTCNSCSHYVCTKLSKKTFFCNQMSCNFSEKTIQKKQTIDAELINLVEIYFSEGKNNSSKEIAELFRISQSSVNNILTKYIKKRQKVMTQFL